MHADRLGSLGSPESAARADDERQATSFARNSGVWGWSVGARRLDRKVIERSVNRPLMCDRGDGGSCEVTRAARDRS